jgi:hypothetical protein
VECDGCVWSGAEVGWTVLSGGDVGWSVMGVCRDDMECEWCVWSG